MRPSSSRPFGVLLTCAITALALLPALLPALGAPADAAPARGKALTWRHVDVPSDSEFRGLDVVDRTHAWIAGSAGEVWKTADGGSTWTDVSPRGAGKLEFRDVEATDADHVLVLSVGTGHHSTIYRTTDGGATWQATFVNADKHAFYDCMAMWPGGENGLAMSDPVDGRFRIIATHDAGASWHVVARAGMPKAVDGEFAFAASGTCLVTAGRRDAYLASGGAASRIFHSTDRGRHWTVTDSAVPAGSTRGVYGLAFRSPALGLAVGGDYTVPDDAADTASHTRSAGAHWRPSGDLGGYRSGVAWVRDHGRTAVAVGPSGSDVTYDAGVTWRRFSTAHLDAVQCVSGACWGSGRHGHVVRLTR